MNSWLKVCTLTFIALALTVSIVAKSTGASVSEFSSSLVAAQDNFDPDGYFNLIGHPPRGMEDFDGIALSRRKNGRFYPVSGAHSNRNVVYGFIPSATVIKRNNFSFKTVAVRGISYSFTGHFLKGGVFAESNLDLNDPMLEGHLIKYRAGKRVAEGDVKFSYFAGT